MNKLKVHKKFSKRDFSVQNFFWIQAIPVVITPANPPVISSGILPKIGPGIPGTTPIVLVVIPPTNHLEIFPEILREITLLNPIYRDFSSSYSPRHFSKDFSMNLEPYCSVNFCSDPSQKSSKYFSKNSFQDLSWSCDCCRNLSCDSCRIFFSKDSSRNASRDFFRHSCRDGYS